MPRFTWNRIRAFYSQSQRESYIDLTTESHTKEIERAWSAVKQIHRIIRANRVPLQSNLDSAAWFMLYKKMKRKLIC